jgi:hypothetical protein
MTTFFKICFKILKKPQVLHHLPTLVPEVYFYYFHCEGERKNKPLEPGYHLPRLFINTIYILSAMLLSCVLSRVVYGEHGVEHCQKEHRLAK